MADIVTSDIFTNGQTNITHITLNNIIQQSVIQPAFVSAKPVASSMGNNDSLLMYSVSGANLQQIPFSALASQVSQAQQIQNALLNGCGLINQRNTTATTTFANSLVMVDRWQCAQSGTACVPNFSNISAAVGVQQISPNPPFTNVLNIGVQTSGSQASSDFSGIYQRIPYSRIVGFSSQPYSISFVYKSNWSGTIYVSLRDEPPASRSYCTPVVITGDSNYHLVQIPNIPKFPVTFPLTVGSDDYTLRLTIALVAGSTLRGSTDNTWLSGNFISGASQSNFCAGGSNTIQFSQLMMNPGSACLSYIPRTWSDEIRDCQAYYCTSYDYGTTPGTTASNGAIIGFCDITTTARVTCRFPVTMRAAPSVTLYNYNTGTTSTVYDATSASNIGSAPATQLISGGGFTNIFFTSGGTVGHSVAEHYTASAE